MKIIYFGPVRNREEWDKLCETSSHGEVIRSMEAPEKYFPCLVYVAATSDNGGVSHNYDPFVIPGSDIKALFQKPRRRKKVAKKKR